MVDDILFQTLTTFAYVGISFGNMNPCVLVPANLLAKKIKLPS